MFAKEKNGTNNDNTIYYAYKILLILDSIFIHRISVCSEYQLQAGMNMLFCTYISVVLRVT